jgi:hypothetical protein
MPECLYLAEISLYLIALAFVALLHFSYLFSVSFMPEECGIPGAVGLLRAVEGSVPCSRATAQCTSALDSTSRPECQRARPKMTGGFTVSNTPKPPSDGHKRGGAT